jgi:geranylgeranyl diphosphate synthase type I
MPGRDSSAERETERPATGYLRLACLLELRYHGRVTTTHPVLEAAAMIADTEAEILRIVGDRDPSTVGVYDMVRYHLGLDGSGASAGKRMRPLLGLLAYASIAGDYRPALPGAAAVELGHNFSLVHDDIEDGDRERRHRPTVWAVHGVAQAINTGDMLFSLSRMALHRLSDLGFSDAKVLRLMRLYDQTCVALCEGQYIDIATSENDSLMSVDLYFDMIGRKTAALIAASIEAGALLASDDDEVIARYRGFGWALGLAFQLNDDLLGIWGAEQATGKEPSDIARRKKTLPVIYAFEHAGPDDRERLSRLYGNGGPTADDVAEIIAILERSGAHDFTRAEARRHRDEALAELDAAGVVDADARARLEEIIVSVIAA